MELLGLVRSKFKSLPIPNAEVQLDGDNLISQGREDKKELVGKLREMLDSMTYDKIVEMNATKAENIQKQLRTIPIPNGKAITMG
jgi:stress response protein SCP2